MKVAEILSWQRPVFSFEFFLPKREEGMDEFRRTVRDLREIEPSYVSLTYSPSGAAREKTIEVAGMIKNEIGLETVAHITCIAHTRTEIDEVLRRVRSYGIENVLALRGDIPKDGSLPPEEKREYKHAIDLVRHVRESGGFSIGVAGYPEGHPEAPSLEEDLMHLKAKVDAGAEWVTTQLFFNNEDYFAFVARAREAGIKVPIVPGIMPVTNTGQIKCFTTMCGTRMPPAMIHALDEIRDAPENVIAYGIDYGTEQCKELLARGAPGIHFYTLNKSLSARIILSRIK